MKKKFIFVLMLLSVASCRFQWSDNSHYDEDLPGRKRDVPVNIILFIGDGMGISHVTAAKTVKGVLNMERLDVGGFVTTHPSGAYVTDSAASGTAIATGYKTFNGAISVGPDREVLKTVLEYAEEKNKSTGLVATCSLTSATPAVFVSHIEDRNKYNEIAVQIALSDVEVLFGGGWAYFIPASEKESRRHDEENLMAELEKKMDVVRSVEGFRGLGVTRKAAAFISPGHPGPVDERGISLAEMTEKALEILSRDEDGFFLMVEGSQIDWAGHDNDKDGIIAETVDFDDAVGVGIDFAENDGRTLVLVTADHETGGFAVHDGSLDKRIVSSAGFTTGGHTAAMVPLLAFGPGACVFGGIHDNTFIGRTMIGYISE